MTALRHAITLVVLALVATLAIVASSAAPAAAQNGCYAQYGFVQVSAYGWCGAGQVYCDGTNVMNSACPEHDRHFGKNYVAPPAPSAVPIPNYVPQVDPKPWKHPEVNCRATRWYGAWRWVDCTRTFWDQPYYTYSCRTDHFGRRIAGIDSCSTGNIRGDLLWNGCIYWKATAWPYWFGPQYTCDTYYQFI